LVSGTKRTKNHRNRDVLGNTREKKKKRKSPQKILNMGENWGEKFGKKRRLQGEKKRLKKREASLTGFEKDW